MESTGLKRKFTVILPSTCQISSYSQKGALLDGPPLDFWIDPSNLIRYEYTYTSSLWVVEHAPLAVNNTPQIFGGEGMEAGSSDRQRRRQAAVYRGERPLIHVFSFQMTSGVKIKL